MGDGGLATALIVAHLRHVVPQTDTARDFTNELLPYLWRFRASPQGLKGHTNEIKLLVSGEEFESPLQESKSCLLPVTTSGSISQRGFSVPLCIYYTTSNCVCQYLTDIFFYFNNLSTLQAHTAYRFPLPQDTVCNRPQCNGLDLSLSAYPVSS